MRRLLSTWLWMLGLSLALGLAVGTCVRREAERPATFIGGAPAARPGPAAAVARPDAAGVRPPWARPSASKPEAS
jgi:hypothetical protein